MRHECEQQIGTNINSNHPGFTADVKYKDTCLCTMHTCNVITGINVLAFASVASRGSETEQFGEG